MFGFFLSLPGRLKTASKSPRNQNNAARYAVWLLVALLSVTLTGCTATRTTSGAFAHGTEVGQLAQGYRLPRLTGGLADLTSYRHRVLLVNLWATWCPPCRMEMPALEQLAKRFAGKMHVVGIDQGDDEQTVRRIVGKAGVSYDILLDKNQQYGNAYATIGLPTTIIIDESGHIRRIISGARSLQEYEASLKGLLSS